MIDINKFKTVHATALKKIGYQLICVDNDCCRLVYDLVSHHSFIEIITTQYNKVNLVFGFDKLYLNIYPKICSATSNIFKSEPILVNNNYVYTTTCIDSDDNVVEWFYHWLKQIKDKIYSKIFMDSELNQYIYEQFKKTFDQKKIAYYNDCVVIDDIELFLSDYSKFFLVKRVNKLHYMFVRYISQTLKMPIEIYSDYYILHVENIIQKNNVYDNILSLLECINSGSYFDNFFINQKLTVICVPPKLAGIADRLRGFVYTYHFCKKHGCNFKIDHSIPFQLSDYLLPNKYNWIIDKDFNYNVPQCNYRVVSSCSSEPLFESLLLESNCNIVVMETNRVRYGETIDNRSLFNELFIPSKSLSSELDLKMSVIGCDYYAMTFRFANLFGDFPQKQVLNNPLDEDRKQVLLNKLVSAIHSEINSLPTNTKLLITSDSAFFLRFIQSLQIDKVVVFNSEKKRVPLAFEQGSDKSSLNEELPFLSSFVDFFLLIKAKKVIRVQYGSMYSSGFPRYASELGAKSFEHISLK